MTPKPSRVRPRRLAGALTGFIVHAIGLAFDPTSGLAADIFGPVQIVDADTVIVAGRTIRLQGIDAPETDQSCIDHAGAFWFCGVAAREALLKRTGAQSWTCATTGLDGYGRDLGLCFVDGVDIGAWLVQSGWALSFRRYSHAYDGDEAKAREARSGMWAGAFIAPWDWRRRDCATRVHGARSVSLADHRKLCGASAHAGPPGCEIKANVSRRGCIYHAPAGRFYGRLDMNKPGRRWFCSPQDAEAAGCRASTR